MSFIGGDSRSNFYEHGEGLLSRGYTRRLMKVRRQDPCPSIRSSSSAASGWVYVGNSSWVLYSTHRTSFAMAPYVGVLNSLVTWTLREHEPAPAINW